MKLRTIQRRLTGFGLVCAFGASAFAGNFANITIDGSTADWAGIAPAYTDEDGVNNPGGVDYQNVFLANDASYLYIRILLKQPADPISAGNTYIWLDNDNNSTTGFHPFGNPNFGSSVMIIGDQAYQEAGGGFNEGTLSASVAYGASSIPGTDFEFRIALNTVGVSGAYTGVSLLDSATLGVQLASETGTGDSLPAWVNYGALSYTIAPQPVPEPSTLAMAGLGLLFFARRFFVRTNHRVTINQQPMAI